MFPSPEVGGSVAEVSEDEVSAEETLSEDVTADGAEAEEFGGEEAELLACEEEEEL